MHMLYDAPILMKDLQREMNSGVTQSFVIYLPLLYISAYLPSADTR